MRCHYLSLCRNRFSYEQECNFFWNIGKGANLHHQFDWNPSGPCGIELQHVNPNILLSIYCNRCKYHACEILEVSYWWGRTGNFTEDDSQIMCFFSGYVIGKNGTAIILQHPGLHSFGYINSQLKGPQSVSNPFCPTGNNCWRSVSLSLSTQNKKSQRY